MATSAIKGIRLVIYRGWPAPGVYVVSPFVVKLEARLRFSNLPYKAENGSPFTAPKGKIPYVKIYDESSALIGEMGDSTLIAQYLVENGHLEDLQTSLSSSSRATDMAFRALLEDKLYFYNMREKWQDNYHVQRDIALHAVPYIIRVPLGLWVVRGINQTLHGQGTGRYTADEVRSFRREIWDALNSHLVEVAKKNSSSTAGREPFWILGGNKPSEADTALYGFIVSAIMSIAAPETSKLIRQFSTLMDYASRIHDQYFPDYQKWTE